MGKIDPADDEASALLPRPAAYDVPTFARCKVHRDYHIEIGKALYSIPKVYIGQYLDVRADLTLVKVFWHGQLVKVHPRQRPGVRWTDPDDLPEHTAGYALRDLDLVTAARRLRRGRRDVAPCRSPPSLLWPEWVVGRRPFARASVC